MSNTPEGTESPEKEEGWLEVGEAPQTVSLAGETPRDEEHRPFEARQPTPPWKYSVYTGAAGLALMVALLVLPDLRYVETPWNRSFPAAYAILVFPVFALIWGLIGAIGQPYRADAGRAIAGIVLSLLTFGVGYANLTSDEAVQVEQPTDETDERLEMTPQELQEWRSERLRQ
jgi:hypothetical protein